MAETTMPEGLSTPDIPISRHIEKLVDINTQASDYQKKTDKSQLELLTKIYESLSKEGIKTQPEKPVSKPKEPKEDPKQNKFLNSIKEEFGKFSEKMGSVTSNLYDNVMPSVLGPLNLITQPLKDLTGIDPLASLKSGVSGLFGKKSSKKPTADQVAKGGFLGAGFLYLANILTKKGKGGEEEGGGFLSKLMGGGIKGMLPMLLKGLGIGAIIASIGMMIVDGIKGFKLSKIWGTSKLAGVMGAVLGGVDKGIKGMFKNMGKWALLGAGIGSVVPGLGTIIGGLIGAVYGAITGYFGGEKIAKAFQAIGGFFKKAFLAVIGKIKEVVSSVMGGIASSLESGILGKIVGIADWIFSPFFDAFKAVFENINLSEIWSSDSSLITKIGETGKEILFAWIEGIKTLLMGVGENIGEVLEFGSGVLGGAKDLLGGAKDNALGFLGGILGGGESTTVNDAIITKTGKVIHTSKDDNIIATKNSPSQVVSMPDVSNPTFPSGESEIASLLKQLIAVVKSKPTGATVNNGSGANFESLRLLGVN